MSIAEKTVADSDIFARMVAAEQDMPVGVARSVLSWQFPPADRRRIARLQGKNNDGTISPAEREELERFVRVGQFVSVIQAQARLALETSRGKA
jgi:hypothetical protein